MAEADLRYLQVNYPSIWGTLPENRWKLAKNQKKIVLIGMLISLKYRKNKENRVKIIISSAIFGNIDALHRSRHRVDQLASLFLFRIERDDRWHFGSAQLSLLFCIFERRNENSVRMTQPGIARSSVAPYSPRLSSLWMGRRTAGRGNKDKELSHWVRGLGRMQH